MLLSGNGPRLVAAMLKNFSTNAGVRKMHSTHTNRQGNSVVERYIRALKKNLTAVASENGKHWELFLLGVIVTTHAYMTSFLKI